MSNRRKYAIMAVLGVFGFWLLTKTLNYISKDPGAQSYNAYCAKCHGKNGEGIGKLVPPLTDVDWYNENGELIPCIIKHGIHDSLLINDTWYYEEMLGVENINTVQIANITNYLNKKFTEEKKFYTVEKIEAMLDACEVN